MATPHSNTTVTNDTSWFSDTFDGYPMIYPITIYHLHNIILCGRMVHVFWYMIGFLGNIVSLKIWSIPRMSRTNTSALYLVAIVICDVVYQVLHVFNYMKYFWGVPSLGVTPLCEIWNILYMIPQYGSQILVLGFTLERSVSVCRPFHSDRFSKRHRIPKEVALITVLATTVSLPQGYFWRVDDRGFCESPEHLYKLYYIWSFLTESIIFFVIPITTLTLNIFVIYYTRKILGNRSCGHAQDENSCESRIHRKENRYRPATVTLLCISFFRVSTQLPVSIMYTMQTLKEFDIGTLMPLEAMSSDRQWRVFLRVWGARIVVEMLGASHHALSFFIFYASSKQFRWEFKQIVASLKKIFPKPTNADGPLKYSNTPSIQTGLKCIKSNPE